MIATRPIGALIRKIQCQLATWISRAEVDSRSVLVAALLEKVRAIDAASFERSC